MKISNAGVKYNTYEVIDVLIKGKEIAVKRNREKIKFYCNGRQVRVPRWLDTETLKYAGPHIVANAMAGYEMIGVFDR